MNSDPNNSTLTALRDQLAERLHAVRRALLGHFVADGVARTLVVVVGLLLLSLGLDWWLDLSWTARLVYWGTVLVSAAGVLFWFVVRPWRLPLGPIDLAAALDHRRAAEHTSGRSPLAPQVASVLQLVDASADQLGESAAMREQAVRASHAALSQINFKAALNSRHLWTAVVVAVAASLVPAGIALAFPGTARIWAERWLTGSDRPWPRSTMLEVAGVRNGVLQVPRGEVFTLQVKVTDEKQPTEIVHLRHRPEQGKTQTLTLEKFAVGDFRLDMPPQQQISRNEIWGGDGRAEPFRIVPVDRPRIVSMKLLAKGPRDSTPKTYDFQATDGAVRLPPQTAAHLEFETNVECSSIKVETTAKSIAGFQKESALKHAVDWVHTEPVSMRIVLVSQESGLESHPQSISIGELPDRPPRIAMRHSGVRLRVTPEATIPLSINVRDDFGIYGVSVHLAVAALTSTPTAKSLDEEAPPTSPEAQSPEASSESKPAPATNPELPAATVTPPSESTTEPPTSPESASPTEPVEVPSTQPQPSSAQSVKSDQVLYGPASPAVETQVDKDHRVELAPLKLAPGQTITILASAEDDCVLGRQTARSAPVVFRIVKPEELFREILLRQQQLRARLQRARDQADELTTKIPFIVSAEDARNVARQHQLISREVTQVAAGLEATLTEMQLNKLGGEESWSLIEKIILQPLRTLIEVEMTAQRQNLETLAQTPTQGLDEIGTQQKKIVADLDKILKNMSQWDSFIDIVNQVDAVIKMENRVRQQTEELKKHTEQNQKKEVDSIFDE
ncbi:MAG: hypothetical protein U0929_14420 [Planctomycetaceae bacterium]